MLDQLTRRQLGDVDTIDDDRARRGRQQAGNCRQQCALAAAAGAEQQHQFAIVDGDVETVDRPNLLVAAVV